VRNRWRHGHRTGGSRRQRRALSTRGSRERRLSRTGRR
jgi:hypothetical protein